MRLLKITTLPSVKTWCDKDEIMLHACFQLLVDYIEKEKGDTHCNYETHKKFIDEIRFLYKWWKKRKYLKTTTTTEYEDDKMLIRLIKVRKSLWT